MYTTSVREAVLTLLISGSAIEVPVIDYYGVLLAELLAVGWPM